MPPKASSRAHRSKHPTTQPRRFASAAAATSPPSSRTRSKNNPSSTQTRSKAIPLSSRARSTTNAFAPSGPTVSRDYQVPTSPTPVARVSVGTANSNTPSRRSAAGTPSAPSTSARSSRASYIPQTETVTAAPRVTTQPEMDVYIESELHNAIFHDPNFIERFLPGDADKLRAIEERCCASDQHYKDMRQWTMPECVPDELILYEPILNILNTIKQAVDYVHPPSPSVVTGAPAEPAQLFIDGSNSTIPSDLADTNLIRPDLVLFQDSHRHWENVRMPIEVKTSPGFQKAGMKQLSRYARATFAHQLHRRHLYGMVVCRTEATFVRFDRAGILYSKRLDLVKDAEAFTRAFASLLMFDRIDEGYDPAFTFERDEEDRLIYYIDLPESAFCKTSLKPAPPGRNGRTRRFKVVEILCHRESICGRSTIVLRIREELEADTQDPEQYALKIIWRDPERGSEGEILEVIHGRFGLAQAIWHCDVSMPGKCHCPTPVEARCSICVEQTVQVERLFVCDKLKDINIVVPLEDEGEEVEHVDTTDCHPTFHVRALRTYSYILIESVGVPLWQAESPRRFLTAILDAILGYWSAFNLGIMHRDISDGNVLMLNPDQAFSRREWLEPRVADTRTQDPILIKSEAKLRSILEEVGHRDPSGMLSDFDLYAMHSSVPDHVATSTESPDTTETGFSRSSRRRLEEDLPFEPGSKRRKTNSHAAAPVISDSASTRRQNGVGGDSSQMTQSRRTKRRLIDFRTGTPAFMSVCVLSVKPGVPYHHHFLDDLESFFWLMLWSTAEHLDKGQRRPTTEAQDTLNELNQEKLKSMRSWKRAFLADATDPQETERVLEQFGNEWASDFMVTSVIVNMGTFLSEFATPKNRKRLDGSPDEAFGQVVRIFLDALRSDE